ncbi:MAG: TlpA family protein disulfide reductase [Nitrosomonas sp.]|nr:MAG: TlpA family protein disulfide reductase [Nitrosomonas sp.]
MSKSKQFILYSFIAIVALGSGSFIRSLISDAYQTELTGEESLQGAQAILAARLPDLNGTDQAVSQWLGKVIVVNFWATWCTPCREEIPEFIEAQQKYGDQGLLFVGIAIDQADKVKMFSKEFGINYPVLVGGMNTWSLLEEAGNRHSALPYTVVINRSGELVENYLGRVNLKKLEKLVVPLLQQKPQAGESTTAS